MYCPLCKAEYRDGFHQCSDCLAILVSKEEALATNVALLWKGTSNHKFDDIVAALREANIPNYSRSSAKAERKEPLSLAERLPYISQFMQLRRNMSWEISVLEADLVQAKAMALRD
jgi:hypothetical protein